MQTATVTVDYVNQPKPGKKKGSIKTKELGYIGVWPDKLDQFEKGATYTINYVQEGEYKDFKGMAGSMAKPSGAPPKTGVKSPNEEASMFAMGFLNRLYAGTGQFPGSVVLAQQVRDCRAAWLQALAQNEPQGPDNSDDPPY